MQAEKVLALLLHHLPIRLVAAHRRRSMIGRGDGGEKCKDQVAGAPPVLFLFCAYACAALAASPLSPSQAAKPILQIFTMTYKHYLIVMTKGWRNLCGRRQVNLDRVRTTEIRDRRRPWSGSGVCRSCTDAVPRTV